MIPTVVSNTHEEQINFQKYWLVLKRRWLPATAIFVSMTGILVFKALSEQPIYEAEAQILIRTDKSSQLVGLEEESGQIEVLGKDSNPIVTEAEILKSRPIIENVIKQLDLKNDQGERLNYQQLASKLDVQPIVGTDVLQVLYQDTDPKLAASITNKIIELYVQADTLSNRAAPASALKFIKAELPKVESTVAKAEADLREFKTRNNIANLSQEAENYINTIGSLESEIEAIAANLEDINGRFEQLQSKLNLSWSEAVVISSLEQSAIPQLVSELQQVRVDLINQRDQFSEDAPQVLSLKEREVELEDLLDKQIAKIQGIQQIGLLKNKILNIGVSSSDQEIITEFAKLGVERSGLFKKLAALESSLQIRQQNLQNLPLLEEQQRELERRVEATQSTYQNLLVKLQETQVAENQNVGNVRIIADAVVPEQPVGSAKKKLIILIGGALGALFGGAVAFFLDFQDRSIKDSGEAEEIFGYPLKGVIPDLGQLTENNGLTGVQQLSFAGSRDSDNFLVSTQEPNFAALRAREAYHMLQANLKLYSMDWDYKAIAITSSVPQEGKSQIAANLAMDLAQIGRRVLLIDADLRKPSQHNILGLSNSVGLSNVLLDEIEAESAIKLAMPNLEVLTAGDAQNNPVPLFHSQRIHTLIKTFFKKYDCVILDTPPLNGMADTVVLSNIVDGFLLVVRPGVLDYDSAIAAKKLLINTEKQVFGIVANGVNIKNEPYNKSYMEHH
jgi:polysaccharide biosynthesis transport protein